MFSLHEATERLYDVLSRYPRPGRVAGCPCCVSAEDQARLHRAPLRELVAEDVQRYASKALTTWGTEDDLRHYLPRLLELVWELPVAPEILLGKLAYAEWDRWPSDERDALHAWLDAWWLDTLRSEHAWRAPSALRAVARAGGSVEELLETLEQESAERARPRAAALAVLELLAYERKPVWLSEHAADIVSAWLATHAALLERALGEAPADDREHLRACLDALLLRARDA